MRWFNDKSIPEADMLLLAGTELMAKLLSNRLVIVYDSQDTPATPSELGLYHNDITGMYHYRKLTNSKDNSPQLIEILFENNVDRILVEEHLSQYKLGQM